MQMKKRLLQTAAVLIIGALLYAFGIWEGSRQAQFTGEKEKRCYPTGSEARERAEEEPVLCAPLSDYVSEKETGIAEGLLAELQEYVRLGEQSEAIEAYRDEALLLDVEELTRLCPAYESLIVEAGLCESSIIEGQNVLEGIAGIYQVPLSGEGSDTLLVQYEGYGGNRGYWVLLKKVGERYQVGLDCIGAGDAVRQVKERRSVIFTWGDGEERGCYLLEKTKEKGLFVRRLVLCEDWEERVEDSSRLFDGDGKYIRQETTRAVPDFYYLNRKSSLLPAVKAYVEANMACFADKLYGWDGIVWRDLTIWGDEESVVLTEEEEQQIEEVLGRRVYSGSRHVVCADYDNDGDAELFFREEDEGIRLLFWEDGVCKAEPVALYDGEAAVRMWFVEFAGQTVTFEMVLPYGEAYPLLSAYLIEGEQKTLLLTCQLVYGDTVEIGGSYSLRERFGYQDIYGFCPVVSLAKEYQAAPWESLRPKMEAVCGEVRVTPVWEEQFFSDSFLSFIRRCYGEVLAGRGRFGQWLEPYEIDGEEDRERFLLLAGIEDEWLASLYGWAYCFTSPDGSEHFWVDMDGGGTLGACTLEWYSVEEGEVQYVDALTDHYRGDYSGIVLFEGQIYCIITDYDFGTKNLCGVHILPLNDRGEWEHYYLSLTPDVENYQPVCLYGGQKAALSDYVESVYEEALTAGMEQKIFAGIGENAAITAGLRRSIKNKNIFAFRNHYRVIDADNDGKWEVIHTEYFWPSSYHQTFMVEYGMYGYRDGAFVEFDMQDILNGYGTDSRTAERGAYSVSCYPLQIWFEEIDGVTYLFTLDLLSPTGDYLLRACVIREGTAEDVGVWLLHAAMLENIEEAVYVSYTRG